LNSFMTVNEVSKATGISPGLLYSWGKTKKVETKTANDGILQMSLESVKAHRKAAPIRRRGPNKVKHSVTTRSKPLQARPATKQADTIMRMAAVMEIFFPEGLPVKQYANALVLVRALEAAAP
jgi:hypothetical protein